ncbi:MAG: flaG [Phenylobacterium sp.]|nr:flaG [Phenylobacterium sp.]
MENKVANVAATPDPTYGQNPPIQRPDIGPSVVPPAPSQDPVDLRLVIEEDQANGSYIYKQVNRLTGEVLMQFPREDVLKMHKRTDYTAGDVIRTKA